MTNDDDPSGFKADEEHLETASMRPPKEKIRLGEGVSPTRIEIEIRYESGATKEVTASIEIGNLCEHDAGDAYDSETRELDYSDLGRDMQLRVDALIDFDRIYKSPSDIRGELESDEDYDEESASEMLRRERGRD